MRKERTMLCKDPGKRLNCLLPVLMLMALCCRAQASTTATITVGGSEQQISGSWDSGNLTVAFNGFTETVHYAQFSTPASLSSALAVMFSRDYIGAGLCAHASGAVITFVLQGSAPFEILDIEGPSTSFQFSSSGFQSTTFAPADTGTVTLTVNGVVAATTTYGAGATPETVAADLAGHVTANSPVTVVAVNDAVYLQATSTGANSDYNYSLVVTDTAGLSQPSFAASPASGSLEGGANPNSGGSTPVYSYSLPESSGNCSSSGFGYDCVGNVSNLTDSVMGTWTYTYDTLNRLAGSTGSEPGNSDTNYCWSYDAFGNRQQEEGSTTTFEPGSGGPNLCQPVNPQPFLYNSNNQISSGPAVPVYDQAGNITTDTNGTQYLYDADGRICAVQSGTVDGIPIMTGYIYDAEGRRVVKGTITTMSCDPSSNGFSATVNETDYVLDQDGHQVTEMASDGNGGMAWAHTNVWAGGQLIGTYGAVADADGQPDGELHFYLHDWLGTRRAQTDYAGVLERDCPSLPYGDGEPCPPTPTEHLFTGKEHDQESGNDYFGARYYASSMGRWLSPDFNSDSDEIEPVPYANLKNPQTLNLYSYVRNNPLSLSDDTGHVPCGGGSASITITVTPNGSSMSQSADDCPTMSWWDAFLWRRQQWANRWNERIAAHQPPPRNDTQLDQVLQNVNNVMMGLGPAGGVQINNNVLKTLESIDQTGQAPPGQQGGGEFENDGRGGGQKLPSTGPEGEEIYYQEWDVHPKQPGVNRGQERLVTGSDGSAYYTTNHYKTFTQIR
jgi:RHS repeat-associated protein